jgi:hypothetical protein
MTGLISGTPTANGTFRPVLTVSDGAVVNTFTLQLTFTSDPAVPVIGSTAFNVAQKPVENSATSPSTFGSTDIILTPGQTITPYVIPRGAIATGFAPIPNLPSGLQFDASTGTISGTYTGEGVANHSAMYAGRLVSTGIPVGNSVSPNTIRIVRPLISVCQPAARNESGTGTAPINFFDQLNVSNDIPPIVAEATGPFGAVVNFPPFTVTDDYGNKFPFTCEPSSGSTFPLDETTGVTCTSAADSAGAFTEVTFDVTVQDTTPPVITVPSDQSVPAVSALGAVVTFNAPTWTDKVDGLGEATTDHQSGDQFPMGSTVVHCSHTDVHNNTGTGSFNVAVNDITATSVSGSGTINGPSGQASFSINASKNKKNKWKTTFSYSDPAVPLRFTAKTLSGFTVGRYHVHCAGSAKLAKKMNGAFTVDLTDNGSPGTLDTFSMTLSTGYSASGNLTSGDIVIH